MEILVFYYVFTTSAAIFGVVLGIINYLMSKNVAIKDYFDSASNPDMIRARHLIRNAKSLSDGVITEDEAKAVAQLINFYTKWSIMVKHHYVPVSLFNSVLGINLIKFYDKLQPRIVEERERNKLYAEDFEWLYNKIKRKYKLHRT